MYNLKPEVFGISSYDARFEYNEYENPKQFKKTLASTGIRTPATRFTCGDSSQLVHGLVIM